MVVSYWVGSSIGSRDKDTALRNISGKDEH